MESDAMSFHDIILDASWMVRFRSDLFGTLVVVIVAQKLSVYAVGSMILLASVIQLAEEVSQLVMSPEVE
ncbi:hypothetical protein F511_31791 [Dorcoceras hygrometricum]|uniref:Uncharacterized protein n=1 Tax=Dorcoceras hygrometricum TaxID=472368 RepID=A0A2Z7BFC7_9LAMI|nr:hypothetical protein F511_31791 [Dorcoceras hygrometricum]